MTKILKISYVETANSIQRKPSFGIDINPVGLDSVNKNKIPTSISGTFYDLFSPDTNKKEERLRVEQEIRESSGDKDVTIKLRSNPKNFYTFKALLKTYLNPLIDEILSTYKVKREPITESALNNYFFANGGHLAKHVVVKRQGLNFEITLPLFEFQLHKFSNALSVNETRSFDEDAERNRFITNFWQRNLKLLPLDPSGGTKINTDIDKITVAFDVDNKYPKAAKFYKKYLKKYKLTTDKIIPNSGVSVNFDNSPKIALPAPERTEPVNESFGNSYEPMGKNGIRVLPSTTKQEQKKEYDAQAAAAFGDALLKTDFLISAVVVLPFEEACFYVQSDHPKEVEVLDFIHSWYSHSFSAQGSSAYPTYKHSMHGVKEKNKPFAQYAQPKTNGDKLALTKLNRLIYIPDIDLIDSYRNSLQSATYSAETDSYSFSHHPAKLPKFQIVYTDWINNRVAYTTETGKLNTIDLNVIYKVGAVNYVKELNTIYNDAVITILITIATKARRAGIFRFSNDRRAVDAAYELAKQINYDAAQDAFHDVVEYIKRNENDAALLKFYNTFCSILERESIKDDTINQIKFPVKIRDILQGGFFQPLSNFLYNLFINVFESGETILKYVNGSHTSVPNSLYDLAFLLPFKQSKNYSRALEVAQEELKPYMEQDDIELSSSISLKNFEGVDVFLQHQGKALKKLNKKPKLAVICAAAGGGKTLTALADINDNLDSGTVTKPLVLCPNGLIKDYINEANFASKGKLNVVPFDTTVFNNYANVGTDADENVTWDYTKLKALVDNAPINTIFVVGYDVIAGATSNKIMNVYGNDVYESYSHLDFLASCNFDGVWCDESHYLKGGDSLRVAVNEILIVPIPYKRLLTGTIVPNNLIDLVRQMMLLDPSILGTEAQFRQNFDIQGRSKGIFSPRPSAFEDINTMLKQQCTFINIQRKEWASILPELHEYTVQAFLTPNQSNAYKFLINAEVDKMESKLTADQKAALENTDTSEENDDAIEKIFDSAIGNLAAVEAFLANPSSIAKPLQEKFLKTPEDYISPKGAAVVEIIKSHLANPKKYVGKILVFCNTHAAVAGIWNALPPEIKALTIYYSSKKKADFERQFKTDPNKRILIGVSDSLDTGLNLQIADTIIRVDCVWTPGKLEQGNARINRPSLKEKDENGNRFDIRKENGLHIYYLMVDRTIDTIKYCKLTSKTVSLAKFYNAGTEDFRHYEDIGLNNKGVPIEPLKVSLELLRKGLSWEDMDEYKRAYEELRQAEHAIYEEYASLNPEDLAPVVVEHDGVIEGSKVLRNVPYIAGAGIFNDDQLGLVPYLQYKNEFISENGEEQWNPEGLLVHTELGEGNVIKETASTVHIRMIESNLRVPKSPSVIFVVTKKLTSTMEIRDQLVKTTGLEAVDIQLDTYRNELRSEKKIIREEKEKLADKKRNLRHEKRRLREEEIEKRKAEKVKVSPVEVVQEDDSQGDEEDTSLIQLKFTPYNEMLGLTIISESPETEISMFKKYGFVLTKPFIAGEIKTKTALTSLLDTMHSLFEKGKIDMPQDLWDMWSHIEHEFSQGRSKLLQVNQVPKTAIVNFLRTNYRKVRTPTSIRAIPLIEDGKLFMVIDIGSHFGQTVNMLRRIVIGGLTWTTRESEMLALYTNKTSLAKAVKSMKQDGWTIENEKEIKQYYDSTKIKSLKTGK